MISIVNEVHNNSAPGGEATQELPLWLMRLDQVATLLFTFNTVTLMLGMGAATYWKEVTNAKLCQYFILVPKVLNCPSVGLSPQ